MLIRLIFKNTKDPNEPKNQIDDKRVKEIEKISNTMKVKIPNKFDSNIAIREFIQSREFIAAMKQNMNI